MTTVAEMVKEKMTSAEHELERLVADNIGRFDAIALLELLADMGYRPEDLFFESHATAASQPSLVQKIEFRREPARAAVITVNFGLLGPQSPLPSYFQKVMEGDHFDDESFTTFIRFFDHQLIQGFLFSIYPELNTSLFRDWEHTKRCYLKLTGLTSTSTMHWLFQGVFPEAGIEVQQSRFKRELDVAPIELGRTPLGEGALGAKSRVPVPGFDVTLTCDEESTSTGRPWADEIRRRLRASVFPILRDGDTYLRISLVIRSQRGFAQLHKGIYLGFDRLKGGPDRPRIVSIHNGAVPQA